MLRTAFSTGFTFHYWPNDNGYNPEKHRVKAKFYSLKEEILASGFLSAAEWSQFVELKAKKYMNTNRARKMKAAYSGFRTRTNQIKEDSPVTLEHLAAIILYCDFSKLSSAFSDTFRRQNVFESVESVISRHSVFGNFGRLLVEVVLDFGESGRDGESGPFFCGLNSILNIGAYAIRLQGPCSTTTAREIALNFAKGEGILMTLKNDSFNGRSQSLLNCAWISNFHEESERLWIAGKYPLRIVSITIVKTAQNYQKAMRSLYLFDWMISDSGVADNIDVKEEPRDKEFIANLFDFSLNSVGTLAVDPYLRKDCELFLQQKETVTLKLDKIFENLRNMSKLVLHNIVKRGCSRSLSSKNPPPKGNDNVVRAEWLHLFPSLRTLVINDTVQGGEHEFRLDSLLQTVKQISKDITVYVMDHRKWCKGAMTDDIVKAYDVAGWSVKYEKNGWQYRLIIKSKE